MKRLLFICSQNKLRSPTAENVFSNYPGIEVRSAGLNNDATHHLSSEDLLWANYIFVMEKSHKNKLQKKYKDFINNQKIIVLNIPDEYEFMDIILVNELKRKVEIYLK